MNTIYFTEPTTENIAAAADIIRRGGLLGIPTETVYGLGANALDEEAVLHIFEAKGRPQDNPLIIHVPDASWLERYCKDVPESAHRLAERFWPGPLTMILPRKPIVPLRTTGGLDTVGVRCPNHPVTLDIIRAADVPIAAPSGNTSGRPSPTCLADMREDMDGKIDGVFDGGPCAVGVESTIIDLTVTPPRLLRPGGGPGLGHGTGRPRRVAAAGPGTAGGPLRPGERPLDGEIDLSILRGEHQDLDGLPLLQVVMYVVDKRVGDLGDVDQAGLPIVQGHERAEFGDGGHLSFQNAPYLKLHIVYCFSFRMVFPLPWKRVVSKKTGSRHKRGRRSASLVARLRSVAHRKHTLIGGDQPQLFLRDLLHLILGGALGDVRGQGGVFLLLGLDLGRQGVPLGLGVLHLAVEAA